MKSTLTRGAARLLALLCALAVTACAGDKKDPAPDGLVGVRYAQTQCADRWGPAPSPPELVAAAQTYLAHQGVTLHQPTASTQNAGAVCTACTCPTGVVLQGTVVPADLSAVLALGFTKQ